MSALDHPIRASADAPLPDGFDSVRGRIIIESFPPYPENGPHDPGYTLIYIRRNERPPRGL
jgi:hypothetical protein